MRIYVLMDGCYREETPERLFFLRRSAQAALDDVTRMGGEPYLLAFDCLGMPVECDIKPSGDALAQRELLRDTEREAWRKRRESYVADGGVLYSTSHLSAPAQSVNVAVGTPR